MYPLHVDPTQYGPHHRKRFENPILKSRDSFASDQEKERGEERLKELLELVSR